MTAWFDEVVALDVSTCGEPTGLVREIGLAFAGDLDLQINAG